MSKYTSSIINKYGDRDKVPADCKIILDIIQRQGTNILIDCIAEYVGSISNKNKLTLEDRDKLFSSLVKELENALSERI